MHVRFSDTAEADLQAIYDYIANDNPQAAQRVVDRLIFAAYQLGDFPFLGRPGKIQETREWSVSGTSYVIVYAINDDGAHIDVETILHTARQFPPDGV